MYYFQDLMEMYGITDHGTYMGALNASQYISEYCRAKAPSSDADYTACLSTLQPKSEVLSLLISEYQHRGEYRLAFPTFDYQTRYSDILAAIRKLVLVHSHHTHTKISTNSKLNFPSPRRTGPFPRDPAYQMLYDIFTTRIVRQQHEPPGGVDGTSHDTY